MLLRVSHFRKIHFLMRSGVLSRTERTPARMLQLPSSAVLPGVQSASFESNLNDRRDDLDCQGPRQRL
jgi:hypothetical protein